MIKFGFEKNVCEEVSLEEGLRQASILLNEFDFNNAVGLAANQIGLTGRVFLALIGNKVTIFINPILHDKSGFIYSTEGCLSFPGKQCVVLRSDTIFVSDLLNPKKTKLTGFDAIVWQHEYDHLDGITMLDKERK